MKDNQRKLKQKNIASATKFLLPGMILFILFFILPMIYSFRVSLFDWNVLRPEKSEYIGLLNYSEVLSDPIFRRAIINTVVYTVITVVMQLAIGLTIAMLLNQKIRGRTTFRVLYYLPVVTSWVIVSLLFEYLFNGQAGLVNYLLVDVLHLANHNIQWFADPILAMIPIMILGIWKGVGWTAIIYLGGLQSIPQSIYEAAEVDGANKKNMFFKITLPSIKAITAFLVVVLTIGGLNTYISPLLMTDGGNPMDQTHFVLTYMYEKTIDNMNFGLGSSVSVILTIIVFIISVVQIRMITKGDD